MAKRTEMLSFVTKIIESGSTKESITKLIKNFENYLRLTKSLSKEDEDGLNNIIKCLDEILKIKNITGICIDLNKFFDTKPSVEIVKKESEEKEHEIPKKKFYSEEVDYTVPKREVSHYTHYRSSYSSSFCGPGVGGAC